MHVKTCTDILRCKYYVIDVWETLLHTISIEAINLRGTMNASSGHYNGYMGAGLTAGRTRTETMPKTQYLHLRYNVSCSLQECYVLFLTHTHTHKLMHTDTLKHTYTLNYITDIIYIYVRVRACFYENLFYISM